MNKPKLPHCSQFLLLCILCLTLSACANAGSAGTRIDGVDVSQEIDEYLSDFVECYTSDVVEEAEPSMIIQTRDISVDGREGLLVEYTDRSGRLWRYELSFYGNTENTIINYYFCDHFVWIHRQHNHYSSTVLSADYPDVLYTEDESWILMGEEVYLFRDGSRLERMEELPELPLPDELTAAGENSALAYGREADLHMIRGEYAQAVETLQTGVDVTGDKWLAERLDYLRANLVLAKVERYKDGKFLQEMSYLYEYDAHGNETKNLYYSQRGHLWSGWEREYGPQGEELKYTCYEKGGVSYWEEYGYDQDGKMLWHTRCRGETAEEYQAAYREEYEYDERGNVAEYRYYREDGELILREEYKYDDAGRRVWELRKFDDGGTRYSDEYEYDSFGNVIERISYDADGEIYFREQQEYDEVGNQTKSLLYGGDGELGSWEEWQYDEAGKITKYAVYNEGESIDYWREYEYDRLGREIRRTEYNGDGKIYCLQERVYAADGSSARETYYGENGIEHWKESEYDQQGNMIRSAFYDSDGSPGSWWEREYDENGVMRKSVSYRRDGSVESWYEYNAAGHATREVLYDADENLLKWDEYQYDQYGHCVHIDCFDEDGELIKQEDKCYDALGNLVSHSFWTPDSETTYTHVNEYRLMGTWQRRKQGIGEVDD